MIRRAWLLAGLGLVVAGLVAVLTARDDDSSEPPSKLVPTVFVGDSITRGVSPASMTGEDTDSWVRYALTDRRSPWLLEANTGEFGRTLQEMNEVFAAEVLAREPEGVVIMGGTNDALRMVPVDDSLAALTSMVDAARAADVEVWIVSPPPIDAAYQRPVQPLVDAEADLARELEVPYVDLSGLLVGPDGDWATGLSFDGVHPTPDGARRIADAVLDQLEGTQ